MANRPSFASRQDSERLRGFCDGRTDRRTFAILESLSRLKSYVNICHNVIVKCSSTFVQLCFEVICSQVQVCDKSYHHSLDTCYTGMLEQSRPWYGQPVTSNLISPNIN